MLLLLQICLDFSPGHSLCGASLASHHNTSDRQVEASIQILPKDFTFLKHQGHLLQPVNPPVKLGFQMCSPLTPHLLTLPIYMHCFWNWHLSDGHLQSCVTFRSTFYMYWRLSDRSCENNNKKNKIRCNSNLSLKTIIKMSAKCEEEKACDCISWMFRLLCTNNIIYKCMFFVLVFYC